MSKNTPEDNLPTIENQLKTIQAQLDALKNNNLVDQHSIKVVIQSSASFMRYDGEFGDNNGLAEARAKTAEQTVLS
jgi:hypothetical protein